MPTVLITGSSSGIGKAAALLFQSGGWNVAATMRSPEKETELAKLPGVRCFELDVERPETIERAVAQTIEAFSSIDVLVNNAGFSLLGPFETTERAEIMRQYRVNVFGLMDVVRAVLPHFRERKSGTIVNIASMGGRVGFPLYSLYNSTKFAVEGFSESLAYELEPFGIRVRIVEPGVIKTDFYGRSMTKTNRDDGSAYADFAGRSMARLTAMGNRGIGPERVAKVIRRAAVSRGRRLRYSCGPDAKSLLVFLRILPHRAVRAILRGITT